MATPATTFESLSRSLAAGDYRPVYILHGEEGYYIDRLVKMFERILPEEDREYGLTNMYAPQIADPQAIIDACRQMPMMTERQVIIVREAQSVKGEYIDKLARYAAAPTPTTILVVAARGDKLKGKDFAKAVKAAGGVIYESPRLWPSNIPPLLSAYIKEKGLRADAKAVEMLGEYIGTNLSRLYNEVDKLAEILPKGATVTPEVIERNIGISKDYNNFELIDAVATRDIAKMMRIGAYFEANPKQNPFMVTAASLFSFFADLLQGFYSKDRSERGLQQELGLNNSFAAKRIKSGMASYNAFQVIEILDAIRRYDAMSKGSGSRQDPYKMLNDLLFHIATAPGRLPV